MTPNQKYVLILLFQLTYCYITTQGQSCEKNAESEEDSEDCNKYVTEQEKEEERLKSIPWISMPDNEAELWRMYFEENVKHPALEFAHKSAKIKRSTKQAFVVLLGLTGSGKSSTINYLLNKYVAPTSDKRSETKTTTEYAVTMNSTEKKITNLTFSVVDTPGLTDTDGLEQDAKNLASIKHFLMQHPYIKENFPNLVYLVIKISDNRMFGPESQISKLLKGLAFLNAVDKQNNNLIVILSHACQGPRNVMKWNLYIDEKVQSIAALVESYLGIKSPVIVQETDTRSCDLKKNGDWHVLPDGRLQPLQLFEASKSLLQGIGDSVGYEALRLCFRPKTSYNIEKRLKVSSYNVKQDEWANIKAKLLENVVATSNSEINRLLDEYYDNKGIETLYHHILVMKMRFHDLNILDAKDLQSLSMNELKDKMHPTHMSSEMEKIIQELFGLKFKEYAGHIDYIGKGFNLFKGKPTLFSPLKSKNGKRGSLGLPENVKVYETNSYEIIFKSLENDKEYVEELLHSLGISTDNGLNAEMFNLEALAGYNIKDSSRFSSAAQRGLNSFSIEQKLYRYLLEPPFELNEEFKREISKLPDRYDKSNEDNVLEWKRFFEKWGCHVIVGGYLGGSMIGDIKTEKSSMDSLSSEEVYIELENKMSYLSRDNYFKNSHGENNRTQNKSKLYTTSLKWLGGNRKITAFSLDQVNKSEWNEWIASLKYSPTTLQSSLELHPIYQLVYGLDDRKSKAFQKITSLALTGKLEYDPPKTRESVSEPEKSSYSCFPENAKVLLADNTTVKMKHISMGEIVLSRNSKSVIQEDKILTWLHKKDDESTEFLEMAHEMGKLTISPNHILFVGEGRTPLMAFMVNKGDQIYYHDNKRVASGRLVTIHSITTIKRRGVYAPLTFSGNLIVDGVEVSCYANVQSLSMFGMEIISGHALAHLAFFPLRIAHIGGIDINENKVEKGTGLHVYARWLLENVSDKLNY